MTKKLYIIIAIIVVAALVGFWWWSPGRVIEAPLDTSDINRDLEELDVNSLDAEFKQIDQDLDTL